MHLQVQFLLQNSVEQGANRLRLNLQEHTGMFSFAGYNAYHEGSKCEKSMSERGTFLCSLKTEPILNEGGHNLKGTVQF